MFEKYGDVISIQELMEILSIGKNKAYEIINEGKIRSFKVGNQWRITKESLLEYIGYPIKIQKNRFSL